MWPATLALHRSTQAAEPEWLRLPSAAVREPRELWDKLLLALVALMALEWLIYGLKARH